MGDQISKQEDFLIESNLARQSDYDWLKAIRAKGYSIVVYFLCTSNIEINIGRVQKRVKEGGHNVPEGIIRDRYNMGLIYLRKEIFDLDEVHLIENSSETAEEVAHVRSCKLIFKKDNSPEWVKKVLFLLENAKKSD